MKNLVMLLIALTMVTGSATAAIDYYHYDGSQDIYGTTGGYDSLDGTWRHDGLYNANYDKWDGSAPGDTLGTPPAAPNPGGVGSFTNSGDTFLRIQDAGDPVDYGYNTANNNGSIQFVHQLAGATSTFLEDSPVYLEFRIRLATAATAPIDQHYVDGAGGIVNWPTNGIGYHITDGGHGMITLCEGTGTSRRNLSFSLVHGSELLAVVDGGWGQLGVLGDKDYLVMNNRDGTTPTGDVDSVDLPSKFAARNFLEIGDATQWNTFRMNITTAGVTTGTHMIAVSVNGVDKGSFETTVGNSSSLAGVSYLGIGCGASYPWGVGAFDLDYVTVPEPMTLVLLGLGGVLGLYRRKR